jgi:uncharacterized protein (DUF169 family)
MAVFKHWRQRFEKAMNVEGLRVPFTAVKFYRFEDEIPKSVCDQFTDELTFTSCQAHRQSMLGDSLLLMKENVGCVAAAITFGLVDKNDPNPLNGSRVYTDIMKEQSGKGEAFAAPSPKDFTDGKVYACRDAGFQEYALFGEEDVGRMETVEKARRAMAEMPALQPANTKAVFFYSDEFETDVEPDVAIAALRPVELTRFVGAWSFQTGERIAGSMGAVRAVNSDLVVRPLLTGEINVAPYCVGARMIGKLDPNRMGVGMPFAKFREATLALERSKTGYPFEQFPGARDALAETDSTR